MTLDQILAALVQIGLLIPKWKIIAMVAAAGAIILDIKDSKPIDYGEVIIDENGKVIPKNEYDSNKPPGEGWEWRGPKGKGSWYNPKTGETLHPDLNNSQPEGPHWDYIPYKNGPQYRLYPDGTLIPK